MSDRTASSSPAESSADPDPPKPTNARSRHVSRSAAKRESVQLLGSIKDLQRRFSQAQVQHRADVGAGVRGLEAVGEEEAENRPPGSSAAAAGGAQDRQRRPWKEVETRRMSLKEARAEANRLADRLKAVWDPESPSGSARIDTRSALMETARAVRRVRAITLLVSLGPGPQALSTPRRSAVKDRPGLSTPSRPTPLPRAVSYEPRLTGMTKLGARDALSGPTIHLRKTALEVLGGLRALEEGLRIWPSNVLSSDIMTSPVDDTSEPSRPSSQSTAPTSVRPDSAMSDRLIDMDYDEDWSVNALLQERSEPHISWEDQLVVEDRQYQPLHSAPARCEAMHASITRWTQAVVTAFRTEGRTSEAAHKQDWLEDKRQGKALSRVQSFLQHYLSPDLRELLPPPTTEDSDSDLLDRLSDGFLLVNAFNVYVAQSPKPWGFIAAEDIHDTCRPVPVETTDSTAAMATLSDTGSNKKENEWAFRKVGNLSAWISGLRSRFDIPVQATATIQSAAASFLTPSSSGAHVQARSAGPSPHMQANANGRRESTSSQTKQNQPKIDFDPLAVARRTGDWAEMLQSVVVCWIDAAAKEIKAAEERRESSKAVRSVSESDVA